MSIKTQFDGTRHSEPNADAATTVPVAGRGAFRFRGAIEDLTRAECDELFDRATSSAVRTLSSLPTLTISGVGFAPGTAPSFTRLKASAGS